MRIKFFPFELEIVRDNHGCPWRTDYKMEFMVGKVPFEAEGTEHSRDIKIYRDGDFVTTISRQSVKPHDHQIEAMSSAWKRSIEQAFATDNSLLGDYCEKVANDITENLMTDPNLAWI